MDDVTTSLSLFLIRNEQFSAHFLNARTDWPSLTGGGYCAFAINKIITIISYSGLYITVSGGGHGCTSNPSPLY